MCSKHRHSCHTYGQGQQQTPEGTLHTYKSSISSDLYFQFAETKRNQHLSDMQSHSPIISMKICFQCSQVWKPRCRAEDRGREASCSWMKFSHWRKSEWV